MLQDRKGGTHFFLFHLRHIVQILNSAFQDIIFGCYLAEGEFQEAVFLRVVGLYLFLHPIEVSVFLPMFSKFILHSTRHNLQLVGTSVGLSSMQPMPRTFDDALAGTYELLLFAGKHAPPYYLGRFSALVG